MISSLEEAQEEELQDQAELYTVASAPTLLETTVDFSDSLKESSKVVRRYDGLVKEVPDRMNRNNTKIRFNAAPAVTKSTDPNKGALLLEFLNEDTGEVTEQWIPKACCSNLDLVEGTVYVWNQFLNSNCPELMEAAE